MPLDGQAIPHTKEGQLVRKVRRYRRKVASPKQWQAIQEAKQGPCRVCQAPAPNELHHALSRAQGGSDVADNIVPLCHDCHALIEVRNSLWAERLCEAFTDSEYAWLVETAGEQVFERRYGLMYRRAVGVNGQPT